MMSIDQPSDQVGTCVPRGTVPYAYATSCCPPSSTNALASGMGTFLDAFALCIAPDDEHPPRAAATGHNYVHAQDPLGLEGVLSSN